MYTWSKRGKRPIIMRLNNKINKFPTYLTDMFREIIDYPKPVRSDGIIYKRESKPYTQEELDYLADNQIPY